MCATLMNELLKLSPLVIDTVEKNAWLDLYAAAPSKLKQAFDIRAASSEAATLLACRGLAASEFNRAFVSADAEKPLLAELLPWLDAHADGSWMVQIPDNAHTSRTQAEAQRLNLLTVGAGWSKLGALTEHVAKPNSLDSFPITLNVAADFATVIGQVYGFTEEVSQWFGNLAGRPNWYVFVAFLQGKPVGAAAMYVEGEWAWLGISGTIAASRRKGIQSALIIARANLAQELGARYLTAETGRPAISGGKHISRDNCLRAGFSEVYQRINYRRPH
jgi:GNAT superfamily N-acetyltransferase